MQESILTRAKREYPIGTLFYSSTGLLKTPIRVYSLKFSDHHKGLIVNTSGGVIYDGRWAVKV